jgi:hypothetical protein
MSKRRYTDKLIGDKQGYTEDEVALEVAGDKRLHALGIPANADLLDTMMALRRKKKELEEEIRQTLAADKKKK